TRRALEASPRPVVVLVGGRSKGLEVDALLEVLAARARAVVGIGTTGPDIVKRLAGRVPAVEGGRDLDEAVRRAATLARPGDAVLLSPAFSSHDGYSSFVARGLCFQAAVEALRGGRGAGEEAR
ncbi:MAG: glutamate ligase domain-containing protein, partial [Planctomycetota bacterium]